MGGSIPGLSGLGNILSGIGQATGGGSGGGGSAGGTNPSNPNQPNQQQYNFLTDPAVLAQFSMDQGQGPRNVEPPIPPQPTFAGTEFFSPQQTMPYSGQRGPQTTPQWQPGPQQGPSDTNIMGTTFFNPRQTQQPSPQPAQQGPSGYYGGGQETQATPAPAPIEIPSEQPQGPAGYYGGGQQTQETPAPASTNISPDTTAPVGNAPTTPAGTGGGTNIAKTGADVARRIGRATAGTQQPSYYPDIAGSARESGAGAPSAFTPQASGPGGGNPLQAISNFLNQAFGGGLQGMTQQAGPAYGTNPPPTPPQPQATPSAPANAPATVAAKAADAMAPGSAAAAVVAGARGVAGAPTTSTGEHPPLVLRDPSNPSAGYMPDPNFSKPAGTGASAATAAQQGQSADGVPGHILHQAQRLAGMGPGAIFRFMAENGHPRDGAWCGEFAASVMHSQGLPVPDHPETASNWRKWGTATNQPQPGDIGIRRTSYVDGSYVRTGNAGAHVTSVEKVYPDGSMDVIGGNQGYDRQGRLQTRVHLDPQQARNFDFRTMRGTQYAGGQQSANEPVGQGIIPGSQQPAGTRPADVNYQPRDYQRALFQIEGGGNINAPRTGSNRGIAQFGREEERRFGITNRRDINQEARGVQREATENTQHLQQAGVAADPANLYLLHQQGQAGGTALLQADANTPAYQVLRRFYGSDALAQRAIHGNIPSNNPLHNTPVEQITAGQFRDMWRTRFNEQMGQQSQVTRMPIQLAGDINPDIARMVEQRNREMESDRRRNAILAGRPTIEEGRSRKEHVPNRRFHPTDIDEFIHRNAGSLVNAIPANRILSILRGAVQPTTVGRDEDVR